MRAFALVAFLLAQSIEPATQQDPPFEDHSRCETQCAPMKKDAPGVKGCACPASRGDTCDADGNRTTHSMEGCVNGANCKKACCRCCPRDDGGQE